MAVTEQRGHPLEVNVKITAKDAVNILNAIVYGTELSLNGKRAKTVGGKAVRLTFSA